MIFTASYFHFISGLTSKEFAHKVQKHVLSLRQNDGRRLTVKQHPAVNYEVMGFYTEYLLKALCIAK